MTVPIDPYTQYRRALLPADRVRELSRLEPWRVVVDTLVCWAAIVLAWALVFRWPTWWSVAIAIPIIGARYYALFIIGHDGMHRRLFPSRRVNDLWNDVFCLGPVGAVTHRNNRNHLRHHQYLATEDDPDRHKHACFNKTEVTELVGFLSGVTGLIRSARNVFVPAGGPTAKAPEETDGGYTARDLAVLVVAQGLLVGGLTAAFGWWGYPLLWLFPVYLVMYLGDNFRSFAEHSHPESDASSDRHRLITYLSNPVERFFFAPMNMNYHATHHLWPSIPYYFLPIADREIRAKSGAEGLEWRRSYLGYLFRYWLALPLDVCKVRPGR